MDLSIVIDTEDIGKLVKTTKNAKLFIIKHLSKIINKPVEEILKELESYDIKID
jgi:hypothetical protein